jgi:hypothetical protein
VGLFLALLAVALSMAVLFSDIRIGFWTALGLISLVFLVIWLVMTATLWAYRTRWRITPTGVLVVPRFFRPRWISFESADNVRISPSTFWLSEKNRVVRIQIGHCLPAGENTAVAATLTEWLDVYFDMSYPLKRFPIRAVLVFAGVLAIAYGPFFFASRLLQWQNLSADQMWLVAKALIAYQLILGIVPFLPIRWLSSRLIQRVPRRDRHEGFEPVMRASITAGESQAAPTPTADA